jgi:cell wall-associated NlpC family hydrolase
VAIAAPWRPSFDLGPTARQARAWTRLRRRFAGSQRAAEPLFLGGSFGNELLVQPAGSWTQLRRSWDAAELPQVPQLSVSQAGALLGVVVVSCALVRPWPSLSGESSPGEVASVRAPAALGVAMPPPAQAGAARASVAATVPALSEIRAKLVNGVAVLPAAAPQSLKAVVSAANEINGMPYSYGGGHGSFESSGYDCSGAVSYALHGGGLLDSPLDSSGLAGWGEPGAGKAITVYAHGGHTYAVIAGLRWDTSGTGGSGPRWHQDLRSTAGYVARHPSKL